MRSSLITASPTKASLCLGVESLLLHQRVPWSESWSGKHSHWLVQGLYGHGSWKPDETLPSYSYFLDPGLVIRCMLTRSAVHHFFGGGGVEFGSFSLRSFGISDHKVICYLITSALYSIAGQ